jgi:NADPH:quinone reductase-like Zn-dependent oxidoreductase
MARAVQYTEFGGPEVLDVVQVAEPVAPTDGVVVEVRAAGVNPIDWKIRKAHRPTGPITTPRGVGFDAAGVIVAVGDAVSDWFVGDEVIVRDGVGAYATHLVARPAQLTRKPAALDWNQAASISVPAGTAYQALKSLGLQSGQTLLLHGGSGGVGQAAVQFAALWGATVIATASVANHARLAALGAIPVAYGPGLVDRVRALAPNGIDVALDAIGTDEAIDASLELVADPGRIGTIVVGARAPGLGIQGWGGGNPAPLTEEQKDQRIEAVGVVADLAAQGRFSIEISNTYPLDDAAAAHVQSETGHVRGKIVLVP